MSKVIWITGLSASGKTTLASAVTKSLKEKGSVGDAECMKDLPIWA